MKPTAIVKADSGLKEKATFHALQCRRCGRSTVTRRCLEVAAVIPGEAEPRSIGLVCPMCWDLKDQKLCLELYTMSLLVRK